MTEVARESLAARYERYKRAIAGEAMPCAIVDLDAVDENFRRLLARVGPRATVRLATKSVRSAAIIRYLLERSDRMRGLMCYSAREAAYLAEKGFDDLLVAYPTVQRADLAAVCQHASKISLAVDCGEHIEAAAAAAERAGVVCRVVIDIDSSLRFLSGRVHLGTRRSGLHLAREVVAFADRIARDERLKLYGVLAYESHVAGFPDNNPFKKLLNPAARLFKAIAAREVAALRRAVAEELRQRGYDGLVFNGAGTTTAQVANKETWLTEVTIGSGFLASHLFDYYVGLSLVPAAAYAIQTTRHPAAGFITVAGGGYTASGAVAGDRLPLPYLPDGLELLPDEGAGEVQTGLRVTGAVLPRLGDPVFFRHSKAGELAEHFPEYLLIRGENIIERVRTYRGDGHAF